MASTQILHAEQIERKLQRIARQIAEEFLTVEAIHLVSIAGNGEHVGKRLETILSGICDMPLHASTISLNKSNPLDGSITCTTDLNQFTGKHLVLIDDVLNSGKTLIYAANHLLSAGPQRVANAVLVDRIHRQFPVRADFCGLSLSTNLKEHIEVNIHAGPSLEDAAHLMD